MSEPEMLFIRSDEDIAADIQRLFVHYPPLSHDRHRIKVSVSNGSVLLSGNVKAPISRRYALMNIPKIEGVVSVNADQLYDDESIRLEAGRRVPIGVQVIVEYGAVILAGNLPEGIQAETLADAVSQVPGVHRVITSFQ